MLYTRKIEDEIKMYLCFLESYVKNETNERRTDVAKASEDIIKELLNIIYETKIINLMKLNMIILLLNY